MLSWFRSRIRKGARWAVLSIVALSGVMIEAAPVSADTRLFPLISISEQYDSNVFYAPKSVLTPGTKADDFVTFVNPQLVLTHSSATFSGSLTVGGVIGKYINNPDLDFAGVNAATSMDFTQLARRVSSKFTSLSVTGAYQFTPSASAFGGGGVGFGGIGFGSAGTIGSGAVGPFDAGLVANRVRISSYTAGANGSYALGPVTNLTFGYTYTQISFGGQFGLASGALENQLFDTSGHTITAGVNRQMSANDALGLTYAYSTFDQSGADTFGTHTATGTWSRLWTRELTSVIGGGATLIEPFSDLSTGVAQRVPATVQPTLSAMLSWSSASSALRSASDQAGGAFGGKAFVSPMLASAVSSAAAGSTGAMPGLAGSVAPGMILPRGRYNLSLSYNFGVFPSFVAEAGPIVTHVVGAQGTFGLADRLTGQLGLNFARSIGSIRGPQSSTFAFDTYGTTAALNYLVTSNLMASLTHTWLNFSDQSPNPGSINNSNQLFEFSKHMVMISFSYVFTQTQGFFKRGGLEAPTSSSGAGASSSSSGTSSGGGTTGKGLK